MGEQSSTTLQWESVEPKKSRPYCSGKLVVAGHTPHPSGEPLELGYLKVINTDSSRGSWLTALEVQIGELIQANQQSQLRRQPTTPT